MQTYHMDKRTRHHRRLWTAVGVVLALAIAFFVVNRLQHTTTTPTTTIHNAPPLSTNYDTNTAAKVRIDKPLFTLDLPSGWQAVASTSSVNVPSYTFRSPSAQAQQLELFIDNIPSSLAVNRVVLVT